MALRVLLADESSTIKKVMQLALQDYAVEVKSVPVGIDVLPVTKIFKPDIVFADVLLTKKTGYEVCEDLKNDSETQKIPVVLMWSGFIDFDVNKASEARADRSLEKPFDAELLRRLVQDLVPKTATNPLNQYLEFPPMPDFNESASTQAPPQAPSPAETQSSLENPISSSLATSPIGSPVQSQVHDDLVTEPSFEALDLQSNDTKIESPKETAPMDSPDGLDFNLKASPGSNSMDFNHVNLDEIPLNFQENAQYAGKESLFDFPENFSEPAQEEFHQVPLTQSPLQSSNSSTLKKEENQEDEWAQSDLKGISIPEPLAENAALDAHSEVSAPSPQISEQAQDEDRTEFSKAQINIQGDFAEVQFGGGSTYHPDLDQTIKAPQLPSLSNTEMERVIREEARKAIEKICWQILPEITERLVQKEIDKLMKETESLK